MNRIFKALRSWGWLAGVIVAAIVMGWLLYAVQRQGEQVSALAAALAAEQSAAEDRGETPVAPAPDDLLDDPGQTQTKPGDTGTAPTDQQVYDAVAAYFEANPITSDKLSAEELATEIAVAVANYLAANPPNAGQPGPGPTSEQLETAVTKYLTDHPAAAGPQGETGEPGRAPTAEEIAAAVGAYIDSHPLPLCPSGYTAQAVTVLTVGAPLDTILCVKV